MWKPKFTCAQTKVRAIVTNVLAPFASEQIGLELEEALFISVMVDSSNHKDLKRVPILIRYFTVSQGIQIKVLELTNLPGETSNDLTDTLLL